MRGKIALGEAFEMAGMKERSNKETTYCINPSDHDRYVRQISDINDERVKLSVAHGVGYTIVSLTVPWIQGISDQAAAERRATEVKDWVADQIEEKRDCLEAFAALSTHDAGQAGQGAHSRCQGARLPRSAAR